MPERSSTAPAGPRLVRTKTLFPSGFSHAMGRMRSGGRHGESHAKNGLAPVLAAMRSVRSLPSLQRLERRPGILPLPDFHLPVAGIWLVLTSNPAEHVIDHVGTVRQRTNAYPFVVAMHSREIRGRNGIWVDAIYGNSPFSPSDCIRACLE